MSSSPLNSQQNATLQAAKEFLIVTASLPPLMKMVILYCFLLTAILLAAIYQRLWTLTYIVASGMMVTFMVFMVFYMIRPPVIDTGLSHGHASRSRKINLGTGQP